MGRGQLAAIILIGLSVIVRYRLIGLSAYRIVVAPRGDYEV
jgi:hypothetical protein